MNIQLRCIEELEWTVRSTIVSVEPGPKPEINTISFSAAASLLGANRICHVSNLLPKPNTSQIGQIVDFPCHDLRLSGQIDP